jgi:spermidine synthase
MTAPLFQELDYQDTELGELILRKRSVLSLDGAVAYEVKLDGEFLMSSLTNDAEIALATESLQIIDHPACDVLVGGLGLGHTAKTALDHENVRSVDVIEYLGSVIDWHRKGLVPLGPSLAGDPRCSLIHADFFHSVMSQPSESSLTDRRYHAILLDVDHSPQCLLHPSHARFYTPQGLERLSSRLHPGGVFSVWSADPPDEKFLQALRSVFVDVRVHQCLFQNPLLDRDDVNHIYLAKQP